MNGPVTDPAVLSSYQARATAVPVLALYPAFGTVLIVSISVSAAGNLKNELIGLLIGGASACASIFLAAIPWRLELTAGSLRWRSTLGGGEVPLSELRSIRFSWGLPRLLWFFGYVTTRRRPQPFAFIEFTGRRPVYIAGRDGLAAFINDVQRAAPQLDVDLE